MSCICRTDAKNCPLHKGSAGFAGEENRAFQIHQSELNRLVETQAALREALRPFAIFGDALPELVPGQPRITDAGPAFACKSPRDPSGEERVITFADLRRALELSKKLDSQDEARFISRIERKMAGVSETCIARDCGLPIPGSEPYHLEGFCSPACHDQTLGKNYERLKARKGAP